jgi:hypothetical protein
MRAETLLDQGRADEAGDADELLRRARAAEDVQAVAPSLLAAARIAHVRDRDDVAAELVHEFAAVTRDVAREYRETQLAAAARLCVVLGLRDALSEAIDASEGAIPHHRCNVLAARAALLELEGEADAAHTAYLEAADAWDRFGSRREASFAREGADRCSGVARAPILGATRSATPKEG